MRKARKAIIAINGEDTDLIKIDINKYSLMAIEKGKTFIRYFYK